MKLIILFISILSFVAMPLAQETCCSDSEKESVEHCSDHESGHNDQTESNHNSDCIKACCGMYAKVGKENTIAITLKYISFGKKYYLHIPKIKNIKIKILRPPITPIDYLAV